MSTIDILKKHNFGYFIVDRDREKALDQCAQEILEAQWTKVADGLPEESGEYGAWDALYGLEIGYFDAILEEWANVTEITHWRKITIPKGA